MMGLRFLVPFLFIVSGNFAMCGTDAMEMLAPKSKQAWIIGMERPGVLRAMRALDLNDSGQILSRAPSGFHLANWRALQNLRKLEDSDGWGGLLGFNSSPLWKERKSVILLVTAVVVIQSAFITSLMLSHATRLRAERALAESTERMNLAAKAANIGMWAWDVAGDDAWMTEQSRSMFGIEQDVRIDYAALLDRVHPEDQAPRAEAIRQALATQGEYEMEYRIVSPNEKVRWVSARGRCVGTANGKSQKLLGISMDVTARKEAELNAAQQREELGHLSRVALVGELTASLAHELNQPLTAIVSNASAAQRFLAHGEMNPDELREILTDIAADGRRAGEVIRGIKGMVRKAESERRPIDANQIISDVFRFVRADALAHGCMLSSDLEREPSLVMGNAVQLQQVLLNLIINAFDAMRAQPANACRVEIGSKRVAPDLIEVSVRDFGPGLPVGTESRIFDRFFSTKEEGMGMGLAIARSIVEGHGGTLSAENAEGGGARFFLRLPAHITTNPEVPA